MAEETISVKKSTFRILTYVVVIALIAVAFLSGYMLGGAGTTSIVTNNDNNAAAGDNNQDSIQVQLAAEDPVLGEANAPVTIVEFSDPSCPFCAAAHGDNEQLVATMKSRSASWTPAIPGIIDNYVKTGKARIVYKYFPGHGTGVEAMKLAWCANEQGKFWETMGLFFANQDNIQDVAKLKEYIAQTGVDMTQLESCYSSGKYNSKIDADTAQGRAIATKLGSFGTPAFIINGEPVIGAVPFSDIQQVIDSKLAQ